MNPGNIPTRLADLGRYADPHRFGGGLGVGRVSLDALIFEWAHILQDYLKMWLSPRGYTFLERRIASGIPGSPSRRHVHLAKELLPYHWIEDPVLREKKQEELLASHNLGKFDILELFNV